MSQEAKQKHELINVICRTSNRQCFFREHVKSVRSQSHPYIRHIVGADDEASYKYASALVEDVLCLDKLERREELGFFHFPYNLYLNELMGHVKEGWIMFLDDDDCFASVDSAARMVEHIASEDDVLLWKVKFAHQVIPANCFGKVPMCGDISGIGVLFHSKYRWLAKWDDVKESDFRVIMKLFRALRPVWIDEVYTKVNYIAFAHNDFGAGRGNRKDKA